MAKAKKKYQDGGPPKKKKGKRKVERDYYDDGSLRSKNVTRKDGSRIKKTYAPEAPYLADQEASKRWGTEAGYDNMKSRGFDVDNMRYSDLDKEMRRMAEPLGGYGVVKSDQFYEQYASPEFRKEKEEWEQKSVDWTNDPKYVPNRRSKLTTERFYPDGQEKSINYFGQGMNPSPYIGNMDLRLPKASTQWNEDGTINKKYDNFNKDQTFNLGGAPSKVGAHFAEEGELPQEMYRHGGRLLEYQDGGTIGQQSGGFNQGSTSGFNSGLDYGSSAPSFSSNIQNPNASSAFGGSSVINDTFKPSSDPMLTSAERLGPQEDINYSVEGNKEFDVNSIMSGGTSLSSMGVNALASKSERSLRDPGNPNYAANTYGKVATYGGAGAMMGGQIVPGWGHLVGGIVGTIGGLIHGSAENAETRDAAVGRYNEYQESGQRDEDLIARREKETTGAKYAPEEIMNNPLVDGYAAKHGGRINYKHGGKVRQEGHDKQIEVEKGEIGIISKGLPTSPKNDAYDALSKEYVQFNGNAHGKGKDSGLDVEATPDYIITNEKGMSGRYATLAKREGQLQKLEKDGDAWVKNATGYIGKQQDLASAAAKTKEKPFGMRNAEKLTEKMYGIYQENEAHLAEVEEKEAKAEHGKNLRKARKLALEFGGDRQYGGAQIYGGRMLYQDGGIPTSALQQAQQVAGSTIPMGRLANMPTPQQRQFRDQGNAQYMAQPAQPLYGMERQASSRDAYNDAMGAKNARNYLQQQGATDYMNLAPQGRVGDTLPQNVFEQGGHPPAYPGLTDPKWLGYEGIYGSSVKKHGGNPEMAQYHDLSQEDYDKYKEGGSVEEGLAKEMSGVYLQQGGPTNQHQEEADNTRVATNVPQDIQKGTAPFNYDVIPQMKSNQRDMFRSLSDIAQNEQWLNRYYGNRKKPDYHNINNLKSAFNFYTGRNITDDDYKELLKGNYTNKEKASNERARFGAGRTLSGGLTDISTIENPLIKSNPAKLAEEELLKGFKHGGPPYRRQSPYASEGAGQSRQMAQMQQIQASQLPMNSRQERMNWAGNMMAQGNPNYRPISQMQTISPYQMPTGSQSATMYGAGNRAYPGTPVADPRDVQRMQIMQAQQLPMNSSPEVMYGAGNRHGNPNLSQMGSNAGSDLNAQYPKARRSQPGSDYTSDPQLSYQDQGQGQGTDWNRVGSTAAQSVGLVAGAIQASGNLDYQHPLRNKHEAEATQRMRDSGDIDIRPMLMDIQRQEDKDEQVLLDKTGGNAGLFLANRKSVSAGSQTQRQKVRTMKENYKAQSNMKIGQGLYGIGQGERAMELMSEKDRRGAQAAKDYMALSTATDYSKQAQLREQGRGIQRNSDMTMAQLKQLYPHLNLA